MPTTTLDALRGVTDLTQMVDALRSALPVDVYLHPAALADAAETAYELLDDIRDTAVRVCEPYRGEGEIDSLLALCGEG